VVFFIYLFFAYKLDKKETSPKKTSEGNFFNIIYFPKTEKKNKCLCLFIKKKKKNSNLTYSLSLLGSRTVLRSAQTREISL